MREDGVTEIVYLLVGAFIGILAMASLSEDSYERGAEDERAKLWRTVRRHDS